MNNNNETMKQFLSTAVYIEAYNSDGQPTHTGTGFFYKINLGEGKDYGKHVHVCLISNKHVLENVQSISIFDNLNSFKVDEPADNHKFTVNDVKNRIIIHENQDLAVINISDLITRWIAHNTQHTFKFIDNDLIINEDELDILNSDIFMVGFPNSLRSDISFKGIIYRGRLAYPPDMKFAHDDLYIFNMDGYPGNSGSPIFTLKKYSKNKFDIRLVGIQCSIYTHVLDDVKQPLGLACAVKAKYLKELEPEIDTQWKRDFTQSDVIRRAVEQTLGNSNL